MNDELAAGTIIALLGRIRPRRVETDLQDAIAAKLSAYGVEFKREYRLDKKNRLDFYLETASGHRMCIETKVKGASGPETERQLLRYALTGKLDEIVVVTTTGFLFRSEGFMVEGRPVPVRIISLEMNFL